MRSGDGFSLVEVVAAVLILGLAAAAIITYLGVEMDAGTRGAEKMRAWGVLKRTLDGWMHQAPDPTRGEEIREGFRIRWLLVPAEDPRPVMSGGGVRDTVQLGVLRLELSKPRASEPLLSRAVLVNRWRSGGSR